MFAQGVQPAYTPDFAFNLIQLVSIGYDEMRGSAAGILSMRALRADALRELLHAMVFDETLLMRASESAVERLFRYISSRDVDRDNFRKTLNQLHNTDLKEKAMTLAEQWREEGREEGWEKGREEGLEQGWEKGLQEGRYAGREEGYTGEAHRSVIDVLEVRFDSVPDGLVEKIRHELNLEKLRNLRISALKAATLEDFTSHV
jgi:hypothetical protein